MHIQTRKDKATRQRSLPLHANRERVCRYHIQAFWIVLVTFALSLGYEVYRAITRTGVSSFDSFNADLVIFYLVGFGMAVLVRTNQCWAWWLVLLLTLGLIAVGTFYYDPVILPVRHPDPLDWFENVAYLGLLFLAAYLCVQRLRGRILAPGEYSP